MIIQTLVLVTPDSVDLPHGLHNAKMIEVGKFGGGLLIRIDANTVKDAQAALLQVGSSHGASVVALATHAAP